MKTLLLSLLFISFTANAYDSKYVHKLSCSGSTFYGVPVSPVGGGITYNPVDLSAGGCVVYPNTLLTAGTNNSCMNLRVENAGVLATQCRRGN